MKPSERDARRRTLLLAMIGAGLGASGAAAQALFRNPLASPDVLGPSSGAALGAVLAEQAAAAKSTASGGK